MYIPHPPPFFFSFILFVNLFQAGIHLFRTFSTNLRREITPLKWEALIETEKIFVEPPIELPEPNRIEMRTFKVDFSRDSAIGALFYVVSEGRFSETLTYIGIFPPSPPPPPTYTQKPLNNFFAERDMFKWNKQNSNTKFRKYWCGSEG